MKSNNDHWERFLDPDILRPSLLSATMFITTFEVLRESVVGRIRDFYSNGWGQSGPIIGPDYQLKVVSKNKSLLYASIQWLRESDAINDDDLDTFEQLKKTRNLLAHQLFPIVTGETESGHVDQLPALFELLRKIEVWWILNVEIDTDPDLINENIKEANIIPGALISLQILIEVASGNKELLEHWRKISASRRPTD